MSRDFRNRRVVTVSLHERLPHLVEGNGVRPPTIFAMPAKEEVDRAVGRALAPTIGFLCLVRCGFMAFEFKSQNYW